jgi:succinate-semialdehyde dehydrogenase/glutarate-semialdehyde dehydrogenase
MTTTEVATVVTWNPANGRQVASYPAHSDQDVDQAIGDVFAAGERWGQVPAADRASVFARLAEALENRSTELAELISTEMGKPLGESAAEVAKCVWACKHYAENGAALLEPESIETAAQSTTLVYEPLGVIFAVMPWNFPLWQLFRFAVPAVLAGNGILLKHAPNVSGCALAIEELFATAGFPTGLLRSLIVDEARVPAVSSTVIDDPRVAAVTLTGSTRAGAHVAAAAGRALKKSVLELGGSDPFVVLADADLATAATHAAKSRLMCAGQTCIAAKRIIVHSDVAAEFERLFVENVSAMVVGDPFAEGTNVGPLARADILDQLERQVQGSVALGARVLCGGHRIEGPGHFFAPTILTDVTAAMPVVAEETFGPVAALIIVNDDDEAVAVANDTEYGLAASIWSRDTDHALAVGRRIRSGALFVNSFVSSDPRVPFGGIKRSGYGRELGAAGVREFTNLRTIWVAPQAS